MQENNFIVVAKIGKTHGLAGDVLLHSYTHPIDNILHYSNLFWNLGNKEWHAMPNRSIYYKGNKMLLKVDGFNVIEDAKHLALVKIAMRKCDFPSLSDGQHYWFDLIGCDVFNKQGTFLGKITDIFSANKANDVIVVYDSEKQNESCIPYVDEIINSVSLDERKIIVDWDL